MGRRFMSIWFPYLTTDWFSLRKPEFKDRPLISAIAVRGRKLVKVMNSIAAAEGIQLQMPTADAKAIVPGLEIFDDQPGRDLKLLKGIGEWCIRYTPIVALDPPDGLTLDISGCTHLWGGEHAYLQEIINRLAHKGYQSKGGIADTIGASWAVARFGKSAIVDEGKLFDALLPLDPAALRLENNVLQRLQKLGLHQVRSFIGMPKSVLRRRFGEGLLCKLGQALGQIEEALLPLKLQQPYMERLPCLDSIKTVKGIEIAINLLLEKMCHRLREEGKGMRTATLTYYRIDEKVGKVDIGTNLPSNSKGHLFTLFELKISTIAPGLGIELFVLEVSKVEDSVLPQEVLWAAKPGLDNQKVAELLDRLTVKVGASIVNRYVPDQHYWPERSIKQAGAIQEKPGTEWNATQPRPTQLLSRPQPIEVSVPVPDYPPMLFKYKGITHNIRKADGPERIEREWWMDEGEHRDYYQVEDQDGQRYWIFRSGHYSVTKAQQWFIHGYFA